MTRVWALCRALTLGCFVALPAYGDAPDLEISTPMVPPEWALLQREVLRSNNAACREFYDQYFDERGWLLCVERWGGDDGPDDAIEVERIGHKPPPVPLDYPVGRDYA